MLCRDIGAAGGAIGGCGVIKWLKPGAAREPQASIFWNDPALIICLSYDGREPIIDPR